VALTDPQNTLAFHASRALCQHRDMSNVACKDVAKAMAEYMANDKEKSTVPEAEALWFYGMNHGMALIGEKYAPLEPLPKFEQEFAQLYHQLMVKKAVRAFYYLVWICTREARHNKSLSSDLPQIGKLFGPEMQDFLTSIKGGEEGISQKFLDHPPATSIGKYCDALRWTFYHSHWHSSYGGKKWGIVNDCLCRFVDGEFTAEMMLDTNWTLAHNGGPIFNKGQFYSYYGSNLIRILDVQRSGQVPEAVLHDPHIIPLSPVPLQVQMKKLMTAFPSKIGGYVDWYKVEALGAKQHYESDKQKQAALHQMTPEQKAKIEQAEKQALLLAQAEEAKKLQKQKEFNDSHLMIMPDVWVQKIKRAA
jgi:hypothetical protein